MIKLSLKEQQRKTAMEARAAIDGALALEKTAKVIERIKAHRAYQNAKVVFVYSAFGPELSLAELILDAQAQGKMVAYPVCDGRGGMCAAAPVDDRYFQVAFYGIKEPILAHSLIIPPSQFDLVLAPGVAFDRAGKRIGYGAGYYDRFLPLCTKAFVLGVAFEEQMFDFISADPHDRPMHAVVTDLSVYNCAL